MTEPFSETGYIKCVSKGNVKSSFVLLTFQSKIRENYFLLLFFYEYVERPHIGKNV